jgi:hypothetical protein
MTTSTAAVAAAQASTTQSHVWTVVLVMTLTLATILAGLRRLRPIERVPVQLMTAMAVLVVAAFGVVTPILMPAREQLDALARSGGGTILAFLVLTATFGTAALVLLAARFLWEIGYLVFRAATRGRHRSPAAEVPEAAPATPLAALEAADGASDPGRGARP